MAHTHRFYGRHNHPNWETTSDLPHEECAASQLENQQFSDEEDEGWSHTGVWVWVALCALGAFLFWLGA